MHIHKYCCKITTATATITTAATTATTTATTTTAFSPSEVKNHI
jgi:hypothetical protein